MPAFFMPTWNCSMNVKLINYTPFPIQTVFTAARTCYSPANPAEIFARACGHSEAHIPLEKQYELLDKVIASGHLSVLEHICFTFAIDGISRACSHQLVRHRIASFSQQSQRYVKLKHDNSTIPPTVAQNPIAKKIFAETLENAALAYDHLLELGIPPEDARFVYPNAAKTAIVMTMNFRELATVCQVRLCNRAQWEIRELFAKIRAEVKVVPELSGLAAYLQPKCAVLGYCPEDKSCGAYETKDEVLAK